MLLSNNDDQRLLDLAERPGIAAIPLGLSVSLDELAIGFTLGLLRVPLVPVIGPIAVQAFIASQVGLRVGARLGQRTQEHAETIAGLALLALAAALLAAKLT
jgi:putative Mn2+ efflux pump MntP